MWKKIIGWCAIALAVLAAFCAFGWAAAGPAGSRSLPARLLPQLALVAAGALLGLETFLGRLREEGRWTFDGPRFGFLGGISLFTALFPALSAIPLPGWKEAAAFLGRFLQAGDVRYLALIVFGYAAITSFRKKKIVWFRSRYYLGRRE